MAEAEIRKDLAGRLLEGVDGMADRMADRIFAEVEAVRAVRDPRFRDAIRESCRSNVRSGWDALGSDLALPSEAPPEALELARTVARAGMPLGGLLRAYRVGHAVVWENWLDSVEGLRLERQPTRALLDVASKFMFEYVDYVSEAVTDEYTAERDRLLRGREQRRLHLVHELLEGADVDAVELGYDLSFTHIALVSRGDGADSFVAEVGAMLERRPLVVEAPEGVVWAWLGGSRELPAGGQRKLARLRPPAGVLMASGEELPGADGFRRSHVQAVAAARIGLATAEPMTHYRDVALEVLALQDEGLAREFVSRELGGFDGTDSKSCKLRETLRAYFAAGQNAAAAAAALGVHDQTVTYRLRSVEEYLGEPVTTRRAELETALRLAALFE